MTLQFKACAMTSILTALFWAWVASLFTTSRHVVVSVFVTVALLAFMAVACVQVGAEPEGVGG